MVQTGGAEIGVEITRAVETDHLVKHGRPDGKPRVHLGLEGP
jgi:hypothetical protein